MALSHRDIYIILSRGQVARQSGNNKNWRYVVSATSRTNSSRFESVCQMLVAATAFSYETVITNLSLRHALAVCRLLYPDLKKYPGCILQTLLSSPCYL